MKRFKNKSNIEIVKSYLNNERPFIQVGYEGKSKEYKKDGDKWTDNKGVEWIRKDGKNIRLKKTQGDVIRELIAQKCKCGQDIKWGSTLDRKFFFRTGLCEKCLIEYETKLRIVGIYPTYEKYKLISYEIGSLKEIREKMKDSIKFFSENSGDMEMICNSEGFIERWKEPNKDTILLGLKEDLKKANKRISELIKIKNDFKKTYKAESSKFKLEFYA